MNTATSVRQVPAHLSAESARISAQAGEFEHWAFPYTGSIDILELLMPIEEKAKGPASYFPSIEKKYGQPIDHWLSLVGELKDMKHMEMVAWLKSEHGLGHGHANAIVAHVLASRVK